MRSHCSNWLLRKKDSAMRLQRLLGLISTLTLIAVWSMIIGTVPANAATTDVVVRPGALHGWAVDFSADSVRPGFVTGPADAPLGEGSFRFDTGSAGAAAAGAKVELSNGGLNDQPVADLTGLLRCLPGGERSGAVPAVPECQDRRRPQRQHRHHAVLRAHPDPAEHLDHGRHHQQHRQRCGRLDVPVQHGGDLPDRQGLTWAQVLDLLPDGAVFQNSLGIPEVVDLHRGPERIDGGSNGPRRGRPVDLGPR